jgi:hypothetical protein
VLFVGMLQSGCYILGTDRRFNFGLAPDAAPKAEMQERLERLEIGTSDWDAVRALFGEPQTVRETASFKVYWSPSTRRAVQHADYPGQAVSFSLLTNPSTLYSVTVRTPEIAVRSLRVGRTLAEVRAAIGGRGNWWTTEDSDVFWLDFGQHGLRFAFARDMRQEKQFPMRLMRPERVVAIERYDRTVEFFEGWVNVRYFSPSPVSRSWYEEDAPLDGAIDRHR